MGALETPPRAARKERKGARVSCRRKTRRVLLEVAILLLSGALVASAQAQLTTPTQSGTSATFADNRARGSVNQTYVEAEVSYNFESGWYVDCDPPMTFDWTAAAANGWTVPIGADVGKAFNVGAHAMSFQIGAYDLVKRPDGAPQSIICMQVTALFPTHR